MEAKHTFEQYAATFGVKIKKYHYDNDAFNTRILKESIITANKIISLMVLMHNTRIESLNA